VSRGNILQGTQAGRRTNSRARNYIENREIWGSQTEKQKIRDRVWNRIEQRLFNETGLNFQEYLMREKEWKNFNEKNSGVFNKIKRIFSPKFRKKFKLEEKSIDIFYRKDMSETEKILALADLVEEYQVSAPSESIEGLNSLNESLDNFTKTIEDSIETGRVNQYKWDSGYKTDLIKFEKLQKGLHPSISSLVRYTPKEVGSKETINSEHKKILKKISEIKEIENLAVQPIKNIKKSKTKHIQSKYFAQKYRKAVVGELIDLLKTHEGLTNPYISNNEGWTKSKSEEPALTEFENQLGLSSLEILYQTTSSSESVSHHGRTAMRKRGNLEPANIISMMTNIRKLKQVINERRTDYADICSNESIDKENWSAVLGEGEKKVAIKALYKEGVSGGRSSHDFLIAYGEGAEDIVQDDSLLTGGTSYQKILPLFYVDLIGMPYSVDDKQNLEEISVKLKEHKFQDEIGQDTPHLYEISLLISSIMNQKESPDELCLGEFVIRKEDLTNGIYNQELKEAGQESAYSMNIILE